jgi:hypothetical protein
MLPNYIVIGAAKCGTSSLCHLLGRHPQAFMSSPKEIHYFGRNDPAKTLEWYEAHFAAAQGKTAIGEGSTSYTHPDIIEACAAEIAALIPNCRLIYSVRNPVARLESDWKMRRQDGWTSASINQAIADQPSLVTLGLYWRNLNVYRQHFSDEQILVGFLEDFARDADGELRRYLSHVGVDPAVAIPDADRPRNAAAGYRHYGRLGRLLREGPLAGLKRIAPPWAVNGAKALLSRRVVHTPEWDPALRAEIIARFAEDSRSLLEFCGKPPDFWSRHEAAASPPVARP